MSKVSRIVSYEQDTLAIQHLRSKNAVTDALNIIKSKHLAADQKLRALAKIAENLLPYPDIMPETKEFMAKGIIHDLDEGHAPYRPRYILPDYLVLIEQGSKYLELEPPKNMYEAITALISMYNYVPSITSYPVYLGEIDVLLSKFVNTVSDSELTNLLIHFWKLIDRLLPDAFVHANLSPEDSKISRKILEIDRNVKQPVPNLTLKYDPEKTPDELALLAVRNALQLSKPYFANDSLLKRDWPQGYGVASCYNVLPYKGGSYTLVRLNLYALIKEYNGDIDALLNEGIPSAVKCMADLVNARTAFIVEESGFF